ncbi:porin [Aquabacterium sp.]|uniref:porin n=1 Tax=Aquabacterium sp. TaxID=1872578 RepID=UPI003B7506A3
MIAKKSLVAVAALLAAAGAAQAQSSVKLYGLVDMGVASLEGAHDKGDSGRTTQVRSGMMTTSFIGFAGVEDLGGGLKAEFTLESFLAADTGEAGGPNTRNMAGGFWSRASNVALSGGFGRVALGQYDNPLFTSGYTYNPFGSSMLVSPTMRHFYNLGASAADSAALGFDTGWVNSVTYESPNLQGFNVVAQAALKEAAGSSTKNSYTLAGSYNAGPLSAMLTYVKAGYTSANTAYLADQKVWNLGASYDLGVAKAFLQYSDVKTTRVGTTEEDYKDKIWQLGASVPLNDKAAVLVSFGQKKGKAAGEDSTKNEVFSLGYDYQLSKRTDVYGAFVNERNTDLESGQSVAIGIRHNF